REEELVARKERVQAGEVKIYKEIVAEEKTLDVPVTREEVFVERHAVAHRPSDRPIGDSETIEVPVYEEDVTVEKRAVVYEEVCVGKRQVQETEHVSDTIRRDVVDIETGGDLDVEDQDAPRGGAEPAPPRGS
ncbi:MAG: YsnF/AvaK domain-containing protein, partial [Chloroflexi bacterium]|nr:YsnF/AvaK domain-containing protein [Chloroflexota bacterium]